MLILIETEKCEFSLARLKIIVPDNFSVEDYRKLTEATLLYPGKVIIKEKDNTYSIQDESGNKIPNVDIEIIVKCNHKKEETKMNLNFYRIQGMPSKVGINEVVYYKPLTKETHRIGI